MTGLSTGACVDVPPLNALSKPSLTALTTLEVYLKSGSPVFGLISSSSAYTASRTSVSASTGSPSLLCASVLVVPSAQISWAGSM